MIDVECFEYAVNFVNDALSQISMFNTKNRKLWHLCIHSKKKRVRNKNKNRLKRELCKYIENSMV